MIDLRRILSDGGGVQTSYLKLAMTEKYRIPEVYDLIKGSTLIFSNTGSEKPETLDYQYNFMAPLLAKEGIPWYEVKTHLGNLHEHYREKNIMPFRMYRSCTDKFKLRPIKKLVDELFHDRKPKEKVKMILGISLDEAHRMKPNKISYFENVFPLIELKITRNDILNQFTEWDLTPPVKSGCFCCPFQRRDELHYTVDNHPQLIELMIDLEENAIKHNQKDKNYKMQLMAYGKTVRKMVEIYKSQTSLGDWWDDFDDQDECEGVCFT